MQLNSISEVFKMWLLNFEEQLYTFELLVFVFFYDIGLKRLIGTQQLCKMEFHKVSDMLHAVWYFLMSHFWQASVWHTRTHATHAVSMNYFVYEVAATHKELSDTCDKKIRLVHWSPHTICRLSAENINVSNNF